MTASEIDGMDSPKNYKKRESPMNKWLNVIFKMMLDGHSDDVPAEGTGVCREEADEERESCNVQEP